jgi:hypothetical protein
MVYIINNYDGSNLVGINDQTVNSTATSLRLPGRDYKPYGEVIVENLVWMLQHFSGVTPPLRAVEGQVWYDSSLKVLKVYDRNQWLTVGKASVGDQLPASGQDGQLFYHTTRKQAYVWDFTTWRLIAPVGAADGDDPVPTAQTNHTQWEALRVSDSGGGGHSVLKLSVGGTCVAILSEDGFNINPGAIPGYNQTAINSGINLNTGMVLNGTASQADLAVNSTNLGGVPGTSYMRLDQTNVPTASGLSLGSPSSPYLSIHADSFEGNATSATSATSSTNATQLNGQAASYYLDATNINAGTLNVARLPYTPVNKAGDTLVGSLTMSGTLTLNADPAAPLQAVTKQYVDAIAATIPSNLSYTTGVIQASPFQNTTAGPDFNLNYFDLPPPVGKTVANLVAFIPSINAIYFSGNVNADDSLHCQWQIVGANIRIWVFNTEQRLAPSANYLAIWN